MNTCIPKTLVSLALALAATASLQAGLINQGQLPWGAHTGPGNQYYVTAKSSYANGKWTISATQPGQDGKKYKSGCIYDADTLHLTNTQAIGARAYIDISNADTRGTWPAFWITTTGGWSGEVDIAEWKGNTNVLQNTHEGSNPNTGWESKITNGVRRGWFKTHVQAKSATSADAWVYLYIDGAWTATHTGIGFVGKRWHVLANLQMEGQGGSPGPNSASFTLSDYSAWGY